MGRWMLGARSSVSMASGVSIVGSCPPGGGRLWGRLLTLSPMSPLSGSLSERTRRYRRPHSTHLCLVVNSSSNIGACAGISFFLFGYPFDYMKTLMQTDDLENKKYKNLRDVFFQRLKEGGVKTFYKGLGVTLIRAIFVNAGAFFSFEASMRALGRSESSE